MATAATNRRLTHSPAERIDSNLHAVSAEADFLPDLAALWDGETDLQRDVFYLEWRDLMARLEGLDHAYRGGEMTAEQQTRFLTLRQTLRSHLALLKRMDLPLPTVPLDC